jgi:hypothetical protein
VFLPGSPLVGGREGVGGRLPVDESLDGVEQVRLVVLELNQQMISGVDGYGECFF